MTISMYQASVPTFIRMLDNLGAILEKAAAHAEARKIDPAVLVASRLYPDMFPLVKQVQIATDAAKGCAARLAGMEPPAFEDNESSFPELLARVRKTVDYLKTLTPGQIDGSEERTVTWKTRTATRSMQGMAYLLNHVLPNFYFHITTTYAILRHNGVEIGKGDFLGGRDMARAGATQGKFARAVAGTDAIEIKATIADHQVREALKRFRLTAGNDEERHIYFFDTPGLDLLGAGIIVRARRVVGGAHDCTVKFRPVDPADVGRRWRKYRDFKIEADASESGLVKSASFSMPVAKGLIKRVAGGRKPIAEIYGEEQEEFLMTMAGRAIDFASLAVLGPLTARRWQFTDPACPWPITAELWKRGDGEQLMEVSIRAPVMQTAVAVGGFMAFLAEVGVERDRNPQTKTRWALDYYVAKLARTKARGPSAGKSSPAKSTRKPARKSSAAKARR